MPTSRRRRRARRAGHDPGRHPFRGRDDVLGPGVRARPHLAVRRRRPHPAHPARPVGRRRSSWRRPPPGSSARTRPASRTTCSRPRSWRPRHRWCVAPAMHTEMWDHPAVQENIATLVRRGVHVVAPEEGRLAGGDVGRGRLAAPEAIVAGVEAALGSTRRPRGPARRHHRGRHARAHRSGAVHRQPLVRQAGPRPRVRGGGPGRQGHARHHRGAADPAHRRRRAGRHRRADGRGGAGRRLRGRRDRHGRRGGRLPARRGRRTEDQEARRRARDRSRAHRRHPCWPGGAQAPGPDRGRICSRDRPS